MTDTVEGQCLYQYAQTQSFSTDDDPSGAREQSDPPCMFLSIVAFYKCNKDIHKIFFRSS